MRTAPNIGDVHESNDCNRYCGKDDATLPDRCVGVAVALHALTIFSQVALNRF